MPPKAKFTREEIIEAALEIVREKGIEAITARELGAKLNSSARPIFTVFQNMDEVLEEVKQKAKEVYNQYVQEGLQQTPAFKGVGTAYIRFAIVEAKLFQLLFMTEQQKTDSIKDVLMLIDESYEEILWSVEESNQLSREDAQRLYQHLWIYTHGIATLCATGMYQFSGSEISEMISDVFSGLLQKIKAEK